ncbi:chromate efflux transporter [Ferrovibrio xuzhouensis]|uniref:Chromate efflux transporter n=1 Tax=Ferrovibrio xuzhouensis TaxID=1576914 RepID=A0ABV7VKX0_9PROT
MTDTTPPSRPGFREALHVWAKIGLLSFGGPAGQIAMMHRMLVDEKKWISEPQFLHALNFCMLLPGPEAQQLATYVGWLLHRAKGGVAAGLLFILPGLCVILGLSAVYMLWREVPAVEGVFFGLQAAVLAIVIEAVQRIAKRAIKTRFLLALGGAAFAAIYGLQLPFPLIVLGAGLVGAMVGRRRPDWIAAAAVKDDRDVLPSVPPSARRSLLLLGLFGLLWFAPVIALLVTLGDAHVYSRIGVFFSEMAVVTFGGAYAVLAYVAQQAVTIYGWLSPDQMLHGLGLAETTPGPLILVLTFVGFVAGFEHGGFASPLLGGLAGGLLATWVTFVPCFLWIFLGAPYVERARHVRAFAHALAAITAAVVGVILNLAVWFALHVLFRQMQPLSFGPLHWDLPVLSSLDPAMALLAAVALVAVFRFHLGLGWLLGGAAVAGIVIRLAA